MIKSFRERPIVVEAIQWKGPEDTAALSEFAGHWASTLSKDVFITTLEGSVMISKGDWIIKGINGEFYPCKPDIFAKTYDEVDLGSQTLEERVACLERSFDALTSLFDAHSHTVGL